ncbi:MAG: hypothetical protein J0H57_11740, partial [Rhodospirillales bacterium]|nr:hypothetical protein [Rhodospirillales bacterium]
AALVEFDEIATARDRAERQGRGIARGKQAVAQGRLPGQGRLHPLQNPIRHLELSKSDIDDDGKMASSAL